MPRLYLHVGVWKTGTSTIQDYFGRNLHADTLRVLQAGRQDEAHHGIAAAIMGEARLDWLKPYDLDRLIRETDAERRRSDVAAFASSETLSVRKMLVRFGGAGQLRRIFAGWDVRVVMYVRNQVDLLQSAFIQKAKLGRFAGSFAEWVSRPRGGLFTPTIQLYAETFGRENVRVISYDAHRDDILAPIADIAGIAVDRSRVVSRNVSGSIRSVLALQAIAAEIGAEAFRRQQPLLQSIAESVLSDGGPKSLVSRQLATEIAARYRAENRRLLALTGIDLEPYMERRDDAFAAAAEIDVTADTARVISAFEAARGDAEDGWRRRLWSLSLLSRRD